MDLKIIWDDVSGIGFGVFWSMGEVSFDVFVVIF